MSRIDTLRTVRVPPLLQDGFRRCPAVPIAAVMMLAIPLARYTLPAWPWVWLTLAAAFTVLAVFGRHCGWTCTALLLAATVAVTAAATQAMAFRFATDHVSHFVGDEPRMCRLRLYLPNEPRLRTVSFGNRLPFPPKQTTLAEVTEVLTHDGWRRASGVVLLQIQQPHPNVAAGQTIEVFAQLERPGIAMNPGQFDWQRYYREQGILNSVTVRNADNVMILRAEPPPMLTRWREAVRSWLAAGFAAERSLDHAIVAALVLGDYDPEMRDVRDQFRRSGTSHHLAISGMHIAVVAGTLFLLLRLAGVSPRGCWMAALLVIGFYGCVAMPSPPVIRAVILFGITGTAILLARFVSPLHLLALTVAVMLALHPLDLFNAGFQLSFGIVVALLLLSEPLAAKWAGDGHILLPDEVERLGPRAKAVRWIDRHGTRTMATGVLAWGASMPLVAMHFSQLNPWQVIASIALAPLVTLTLLAGVLKIIGTALFPSLASFLGAMTAASSSWMRGLVDLLAGLPAASVPIAAPPTWVLVMCWLSLALVVIRWRLTTPAMASYVLLVASFGLLLFGPYVFGTSRTLRAGQLRVTLMAVGAGQCALVEPAGGRVTMIDCGSLSLTDLTSNVVEPVLRHYGITELDTIVVSHANTDHYSAVSEVAAKYGAREVVVAETFAASANETPTGVATLRELRELDLPPRIVRPGDRIPLARDCELEVLWPRPGDGLGANDTSLVLRLHKAGRSILFTGDIQSDGMRGLLVEGDVKADVLIAPHHGSSEDVTPMFVDLVEPTVIVSSNDRTLTGKQRRFDEMMRAREVLRTHEHGAITITIEADGQLNVEGFVTRPTRP